MMFLLFMSAGQFCLCDFDCPESGDYICGGDQQTYVNQCALQKESCRLQRSIPVAYRGQCTSDRLSGSGDGEYYDCLLMSDKEITLCDK